MALGPYNPRMPDPHRAASTPQPIRTTRPSPQPAAEKVLCERCSAEMFRMHAVWRCPSCGYKTDCCGW
jgi:hypothetical protein